MQIQDPSSNQRATAASEARGAYRPSYRLLPRLFALTIGFALATYGAMDWHYRDLTMAGIWLYDNGWQPHPLHLLVLGLCAIPIALWQILIIDLEAQARAHLDDAGAANGSQAEASS